MFGRVRTTIGSNVAPPIDANDETAFAGRTKMSGRVWNGSVDVGCNVARGLWLVEKSEDLRSDCAFATICDGREIEKERACVHGASPDL